MRFLIFSSVFVLFFLVTFNGHSQISSGTYTIGGATPDYATFAAAVSDLNTNGLVGDGAVVFNVRDGNYTENLTINQITNADATSTITIKSENSDSSLVTLTHGTATATLVLNGTDYITFKWLTIQTTGFKRVVEVRGGATNNKFLNCRINGYNTTGSSYSYALFYSTSTATLDSDNEYSNNVMTQGSHAIVLLGSSSNTESGTIISGNEFVNQGGYCLRLNYNDGLIITGNTFNSSQNSTHYSMYLNYCDGALTIQKNKIWKTTAGQGYGIYMNQCKATTGSRTEVSNNFIQVRGTSGNGYGIYSNYSEYINFYFNNINSTHSSTSQSAFRSAGGGTSTLTLQNNIFVNTGGGYAVYIGTTGAIAGIDYNDYYVTGTNLGYWAGNRTTLALFRTASGDDVNSVNTDPLYVDAVNGDLHITESTLEADGLNIPAVGDDFDNAVRPDPPTIGADETGTGAPDDAGVISVDQPSVPFAAGNQNVYVAIKNFGSAVLTSATINWTVNAVAQTNYNWTGSVASNATSSSFSIGSYSFTAGVSHKIIAWATNPSGNADGNSGNDTTTRTNIVPALNGTYTIGATGDFLNFNGAEDTLTNHGIVGAVVFNVQSATYTEQVSLPVTPGSSASNTIKFQSVSGDSTNVVLQYASSTGVADNYTLQLNGADYTTFRTMTIQRTGTSNYARVIDITGDAHNNTFEYLQIFGISGGSGNSRSVVYSGTSSINDTANTIYNNWIKDGYHGIYMEGTAGNLKRTVHIKNNKLENYRYGVYLRYMENVNIYQNEIINAATTNGPATQGLYLFHCDSMLLVRKNNIIATAGTNNYGMDILACETTYGGTKGEISNNMIVVGGTGTSRGIYCNATTNKNFYYNSILTTGTNTTSSRALYINGPSSGTPSLNANFIIKNNILMATAGKGIYNSVGGINECDYNEYYVTAGTDIGYWTGTGAVADLAALQTANGDDANSISSDPLFVSDTDPFDLHIQSTSPCIDKALTIAGLTDDIEDQLRATDIGADEEGGVLPIKLLYFQGFAVDEEILLEWITKSEMNNDYFTIERSVDGTDFASIGIVTGAGNSNNHIDYSLMDAQPFSGINYYRLKQTDYDGSYTYSEVIAVNLSGGEKISIYPNPTNGKITIYGKSLNNRIHTIEIKDVIGQTLYMDQIVVSEQEPVWKLDLSKYAGGLYFFIIGDGSNVQIRKIVVH